MPADSYTVAASPKLMESGDFNNDGHEDLVLINGYTNYSILINQGDGTFTSASYSLGSRLRDVAVIMLAGDTIPDLVFSDNSYNYDGVRVLSGNGDGTFSLLTSIFSGNDPMGIASGDFNGDGISDVCVCNQDSDNVGVLPGNIAGGFDPVSTYSTGNCIELAVGLVDGDSALDIVTVNYVSEDMSVLLGDGMGGFGPASTISTGQINRSIALGDIDKDLKLDALISFGNPKVLVYFGDGLGGFSLGPTVLGKDCISVGLADLDDDSWLDIIAAHDDGIPGLYVIASDGAGSFETPLTFYQSTPALGLAIADFNSDNRLDIATSHQGNNTVRVLLSKPDVDNDGMPGWWEDQFACVNSLIVDSQENPDGDAFTNFEEYGNSTDPCVDEGGAVDSDSDGLTDFEEGIIGTEVNNPDTDGDGINDGDEYLSYLTDPTYWDSDLDLMPDGYEVNNASGHTTGQNLDPLDPEDGGTTDFDSDTNPNVHEYWNGTDPWSWDPVCGEGCFCWGDAGGDGTPDPTDIVELAKAVRGLGPNYGSVLPTSGMGQDLDADGTPSPVDITELKKMVRGLGTVGMGSRPNTLVVMEQPGGTVAVGDTCHVTVGVINDNSTYSPAFGVIFKIGAASTGTAEILGGEGDSSPGRYDVSEDAGTASIVLKILSGGTIVVEASIPGCGVPTVGRYCPAINLAPAVTIVGE